MEFIGREEELKALEYQYGREHSFVLMYGRRRVGKSTLIKKFIEGKQALYYQVQEDLDGLYLPSFSDVVGEAIGISNLQFSSWNDAIKAYVEHVPGKKIIVIDEFQYLMMSDKGTQRRFQNIWDNYLLQKEVMLILCGSYLTMMKNLTSDYNSPLYQRNTSELNVRPLPFDLVSEGKDYRRAVEEYAITGGVPHYMELIDPAMDPVENAERLLMKIDSPLINEPYYLLGGEFRATGSYHRYLRTIAEGNRKSADISSATRTSASDASPYLERLQSVGIVRREIPITVDCPENSRKGLYTVSDNFLALWYRFVHKYHSSIETGDFDSAVSNLRKHFIDSHVAYVFEDVCRFVLRSTLRELGVAATYGKYWDDDTEIDVAARDDEHRTLYLGECKYRNSPIDTKVLTSLMTKCDNVREFRKYTLKFCVFSVSGYTDGALALADEEDILLFDNGKLLPQCAYGVMYIDRLS